MLSKDKTWLTQLASYTADLETLQTARRQAPMLTVAIVLALEVHVVEDSVPEYERAISCSLRADDAQAIAPASMELTDSGFRARLGRTKTTGPGKKTKEVDIFVGRSTGISGWDWMSAGFKIWCKYTQPLDFLLLEANDDWTGPTTKGVDSTGVLLYFRRVLQGLGTPKLESKGFRLNYQRPLMSEGAHRFYTGHSPRNFMTSVAAAIGHSKDDRDYLGRWLVNRATGSAEYTRTSREVVHRLQKSVCRSLLEKGGRGPVSSEELRGRAGSVRCHHQATPWPYAPVQWRVAPWLEVAGVPF